MTNQIEILGYEQNGYCEHCGRALKHCIRLSDGRIVGATCLDKQLTLPKEYRGKKFRLGSEFIIRAAKVAQFYAPSQWSRFGVNAETLTFNLA
jgi:hypothetical protein